MNTTKPFKTLTLTLAALCLSGSAFAHRQWILPSTSILSGKDQWISVEAAISNNLYFPNHHAISADAIKVVGPTGKELELQSVAEGKIRTSFELQLEEEGSYRIFSGRSGMFGSWMENGERKRKRGSADDFAAMDLDKLEDLQLRSINSRVETIVTSGAPTDLSTLGEGLEFEFLTHPNDLYTGEPAQFRVLLDGEPLANQEVTVIKGNDRFRDTPGEQKVTSDEDGIVEISWPEAGRYWINTSARGSKEEFHGHTINGGASYTLTVEVLPL